MDTTALFEAERTRLTGLAAHILRDPVEAEDIVQQAWLRWDRTDEVVDNPPAWLTTVTSRLCLDRLRARTAVPTEEIEVDTVTPDPLEDVLLADAVGDALHLVLDRLSPRERVAFVLHDSFGVEFATVARILDTSPSAARKLASRAREKVRAPQGATSSATEEIVDAFLAAARTGEFARLLELLAPDAVIAGDPAAVLVGTPEEIAGRDEVATFFNGAAAAALAVFVDQRPGAAWFDRGRARVAFDFTVADGVVQRIDFRADPTVLANLRRRRRHT